MYHAPYKTDGPGGRDVQLGSVCSVLNANHLPLETIHYTPYGMGAPTESLHGFTGEPTDSSGLKRTHAYDAAGRLRKIEYREGTDPVGMFAYDVDARGNRIKATEQLRSAEVPLVADDLTTVSGSWVQNGDFFETIEMFAEIQFEVAGNHIELVMGEGPDHGIYDVYVNNILWGSPDGYNAIAGERTLVLNMTATKTHTVRIRGRADQHKQSTGRKIGFKLGEGNFVERVIQYSYDALARLLRADTYGNDQATTPTEEHVYTYDLAGNRLSATVLENSVQTSQQTHTFDAANRISSAGFSYDNAGRLLSDGTTTYTWDRAERLLSTDDTVNTHAYAYNGLGQRVQQSVNSVATTYLLDVQPGLYNVLASTTGPDTTRFVKHGNRSLRQQQPSGEWQHLLTDGLGSVRSVLDADLLPLETVHYTPYGTGAPTASLFGFTGEPTDANGLVHLRARYYDPALGVLPSLDPMEGNPSQPLSVGRYMYVQGNPINALDPSGMFGENSSQYTSCQQQGNNCQALPSGRPSEDGSNLINSIPDDIRQLYSSKGIILTVACGQNLSWSDGYVSSVQSAISVIENTTGISFADAFGELEFRLHGQDKGYGAELIDERLVEWYNPTIRLASQENLTYNIVHELGHVLDTRSQPEIRSYVEEDRVLPLASLVSNKLIPQNPSPDKIEKIADYFHFWIHDAIDDQGESGDAARAFANGGIIVSDVWRARYPFTLDYDYTDSFTENTFSRRLGTFLDSWALRSFNRNPGNTSSPDEYRNRYIFVTVSNGFQYWLENTILPPPLTI